MAKAIVYSLASTLAAGAAGGALGWAGYLLPWSLRLVAASVAGVLAILLGLVEVRGRRLCPVQRDIETPQHWMLAGSLQWAALNGAALGLGATTRIGFWLWYVVPLGALLSGGADAGALVYGAFGASRGMAVWVILYGLIRIRPRDWRVWLIHQNGTARLAAAQTLVSVGVIAVVAFGF